MSRHSPSGLNTCAVVVTYHPDSTFPLRFAEIKKQFPNVVIVDNGSNEAARRMLVALVEPCNENFLGNAHNLGVAAALNQAVELVSKRKLEWIVTFDQDTDVYPDLLATLGYICQTCGSDRILIGPNYWNANKQRYFLNPHSKSGAFQPRKTLITSGMLISLNAFKEIGSFREDYFIDSVDHEFCLRARSLGYQILMSRKPGMSQSIGSERQKAGWLRRHISFDHSPVRKYYIARNSVANVQQYFFREPLWSMLQCLRLMADVMSIAFFETEKLKKLRAFARGISHGVAGKMGSIEMTCPDGF